MPRPVLNELSFTVQPREQLAIMGATGAGKTTLFQLLPRLYDADSGTIRIDDQPITTYPLHELRGKIGYVPQNPLLFSGTIKDTIRMSKVDATQAEVEQAAKDAQFHELIEI